MIHARCDKGISRLQIVVWYAGKSNRIFGIEGQKPLIFMQNSTQKNTKHKPLGLKMSPFEDDLERERKETAKRTLELMEARFRKIRCKQPWRAGFLKRRREEWLKWPWRVRMPKSTLSCQSPYVFTVIGTSGNCLASTGVDYILRSGNMFQLKGRMGTRI